jgi:hypothetical protein
MAAKFTRLSDTTAPSGRELYHLQFSLQVATPENSGCRFIGSYNKSYYLWPTK